jgi:hypothetical protein
VIVPAATERSSPARIGVLPYANASRSIVRAGVLTTPSGVSSGGRGRTVPLSARSRRRRDTGGGSRGSRRSKTTFQWTNPSSRSRLPCSAPDRWETLAGSIDGPDRI